MPGTLTGERPVPAISGRVALQRFGQWLWGGVAGVVLTAMLVALIATIAGLTMWLLFWVVFPIGERLTGG